MDQTAQIPWSWRSLLTLAHSNAAQDLAEGARAAVRTYADAYARGAERTEFAHRLVADAEHVRLLAVAADRARGVSWEDIGEVLGVSRQAAHERYAARVAQLELDVLLPHRSPSAPGALGWTAGPECAADPGWYVRHLDAWAARHAEHSDGGREHRDELVSYGLRTALWVPTDNIGPINRLGEVLLAMSDDRLVGRDHGDEGSKVPRGLTETYVLRRRAELQFAMYDAIASDASPDASRRIKQDAARYAQTAYEELVKLWTAETRPALTVVWDDAALHATVKFYDKPVATLERNDDARDPEAMGWWWLTNDPDLQLQVATMPLDGVDVDAPAERVEPVILEEVASHIGSDRAKGVGPFDPGGIASTAQANTPHEP